MANKWFVDGMEVTTKLEEALVHGFIDLKQRIEALEKPNPLVDTKVGVIGLAEHIVEVLSRLEELEAQLSRLDMSTITAAVKMLETERERKARWHATRDAALPAIVATAVDHGMTAADCVQDAAMHADEAHGPLEATPRFEEVTEENLSRVEALVQACVELWDSKVLSVDEAGDRYVSDAALQKMKRCLKPFEQEAG